MTGERGRPPLTPVRAALAAALLALLLGLAALPGAFLADDFEAVLRNPLVERPDLAAIFTSDYWGRGRESGLYRPLTVLSFALDRLVFGPGPAGHHFVNALLHAATAYALVLALAALGVDAALALAAGALFAAHPVHTDVVGIVVGRAELLVALLLFAALRLALAGQRRWWPAVLACYLAALLAKEHAVVFLPLLAVGALLAAPDAAAAWRRDRGLLALAAAVTLGWLLLRRAVFLAADAPQLLVYAADNPLHGVPLADRLRGAAAVNLRYLLDLALPWRLQSVYSGPALRELAAADSWRGLAGAAWIVGASAAAVLAWRRRSPCAVGLLVWFAGFAVTGNVLFTITVLMADRFAYLPAAGLCLCAAHLLLLPARRASSRRAARGLLLIPSACVLALAALTLRRDALLQDPPAFWHSSARIDPGNVRAWFFLAQSLLESGNPADAEQALSAAIRADDSLPDAHIARSFLLLGAGRPVEAAAAARVAIARAPGGAGLAQLALAQADLALGRPAEALALLDEAAPMLSASGDWWDARSRALEALGDLEGAIAACRQAGALLQDRGQAERLEHLMRIAAGRPSGLPSPPRQREIVRGERAAQEDAPRPEER